MIGNARDRGFEFVRLSVLRAEQLRRGCVARVPECLKLTSTAQREVAAGKVLAMPRVTVGKL